MKEMAKRVIDILISIIGIVVLAIPLLLVALLIKIESRGPVFYRQLRVGRNNCDFRIFKFRTMKNGSEDTYPLAVGDRDSRITKLGYYLRKWKIDEFPQLLNVLRGEMSIVGPRPVVRLFVEKYTPSQMRVLSVRPGITDAASIKYMRECDILKQVPDPLEYYLNVIMPDKLRLNEEYIDRMSIGRDFCLIAQTLLKLW